MDPVTVIGAVASVATLLDTITGLARRSKTLFDRLRNAPDELKQLETELLAFEVELGEIARLSALAPQELLLPHINQVLLSYAHQAQGHLEAADTTLRNLSTAKAPSSLGVRLRWVLKDRQHVEDALTSLRKARESLFGLMHLIMLNISLVQHKSLDSLKRDMANLVSAAPLSTSAQSKGIAKSVRSQKPAVIETKVWRSGTVWKLLGVNSTFVSTDRGSTSSYSLAFRADLHLGFLLQPRALVINMTVQPFPSGWRLLPGTYIANARTLVDDHPFRTALELGDLLQVREMLGNGHGRITDIWDGNLTPLAVAIRHGRIDVVRELLDHGADVQASTGVNQTSHLQWAVWEKRLDIVRLLLARGATQDHVNFLGWNTAFFCWPRLRRDRCMLDYLGVLSEDAPQDLDVVDTEGWTALHRVAAYGHAAEVRELVRLGARPAQVALPLRWTAIHHAVFYGNLETFRALLPHHGHDLTTITDERGWTLLHIAASADHGDIVRHLLEAGADLAARSRPFASHMPEELFHRACTPREVAAAQGEDVEAAYLDLVEELGLETFCDAEEV